jgi:hypothetical protein
MMIYYFHPILKRSQCGKWSVFFAFSTRLSLFHIGCASEMMHKAALLFLKLSLMVFSLPIFLFSSIPVFIERERLLRIGKILLLIMFKHGL